MLSAEGEHCATLGGFIPSLCEIASGFVLRIYSLQGGAWVGRTESPSQGYRLSAASLPCPRRSFGTSHKGAEPTFCVCRRFMRSQEPLILLNSKNASTDAQSRLASLVICSKGTYGRGDRRRTSGTTVVEGFPQEHKVPIRTYRFEMRKRYE